MGKYQVFLLVLALEFVRRAQREYDRYIVRQWQRDVDTETLTKKDSESGLANALITVTPLSLRPTLLQQCVRCVFYTVQFGVA
jgi:copper transporter 1